MFIIKCIRWNSCRWARVVEKPHKPQVNPGWINSGYQNRILKSPRFYLSCAHIWGWRSLCGQIHRTNVKAYLSIILPRSAVMSEAPACYQSLCLWSCLKLARSVFPLASLMPQMASRLSHIVMLQCVNRRNYKRCADTLYTSICADWEEREQRENFFFFFPLPGEWMKRFWAGWK